jgi:putative MATE family efflux protein
MAQDMTTGNPARILLAFSVPMLIGNLFQQFYNIVDTIVVGQFVGAGALAAVGASSTIVMLLVCLATGLSVGCSVLVSQYYGAADPVHMRQAVYISLVFNGAVGLALSLFGIVGAPWLLALTRVPADIRADAATYLVIYCVGGVFLFAYNVFASMCRAIGDAKTPVYFLVFTSLLNIACDLVFVIGFHWGVAGVATATTLSQGISAVSCGFYMRRHVPVLRLGREDCVFDGAMLADLIGYALPSTIQNTIVALSAVAVQGLVNTFGTVTIAGYTAANKIDQFATQPLLSLNMAVTSFTAQNIGAGRVDRVRAGFRVTMALSLGIAVVLSLLIFVGGEALVGLFVQGRESAGVVAAGMRYIRIVSLAYWLFAWMFASSGVLRGAGDMGVYLLGTAVNFVFRIAMAYALAPAMGFRAIAWSIPIGWSLCIIVNMIRYFQGGWQFKAKVQRGDGHG